MVLENMNTLSYAIAVPKVDELCVKIGWADEPRKSGAVIGSMDPATYGGVWIQLK
jgi:hypothetical protein